MINLMLEICCLDTHEELIGHIRSILKPVMAYIDDIDILEDPFSTYLIITAKGVTKPFLIDKITEILTKSDIEIINIFEN